MKKLILLLIGFLLAAQPISAATTDSQIMTLCCGNNGAKLVFLGKNSCSCGGPKTETFKYYVSGWGYCDLCEYTLSQHSECLGDPKRFVGNVDCPAGTPSSDAFTGTEPTWFPGPIMTVGSPLTDEATSTNEVVVAPTTTTAPISQSATQSNTTTVVFQTANQSTNTIVAVQSPVPSTTTTSIMTAAEKEATIKTKIVEIQEMLVKLITELIKVLSQGKN